MKFGDSTANIKLNEFLPNLMIKSDYTSIVAVPVLNLIDSYLVRHCTGTRWTIMAYCFVQTTQKGAFDSSKCSPSLPVQSGVEFNETAR